MEESLFTIKNGHYGPFFWRYKKQHRNKITYNMEKE